MKFHYIEVPCPYCETPNQVTVKFPLETSTEYKTECFNPKGNIGCKKTFYAVIMVQFGVRPEGDPSPEVLDA